ncbi:MAG: rhodanese-like domain-containing protein [Actinomycetes bacterium]
MRRLLAVLVLVALALTGCAGTATTEDAVRTVDAAAAQQLIDDGAVVVDVRTPEEFASGHLADARNIDVQADSFRAEVDELDRDATYVLYCRTGARAGAAGELMREMGFTDVVNAGGFEDLAAAGLPTA